MGERPTRVWPAWVALALGFVGAGFVLLAAKIPWHTDPAAYFAALDDLEARSYGISNSDAHRLSAAFYANLRRYETPKWLLADIGYACAAWAALLFVVAVGVREAGWRWLFRSHAGPWVLTALTLLASALLGVGAVASVVQPYGRQELPEWADSTSIAFIGLPSLMEVLTLIFLALILAPLVLRSASGRPLHALGARSPRAVFLATAFYAPFILAALVLMVGGLVSTGGWAFSTSGALLSWLLLNARALAVTPRAADRRHDIDLGQPFPYIRPLLVKPPDASVRAPEN
jgi:hypothetical protein